MLKDLEKFEDLFHETLRIIDNIDKINRENYIKKLLTAILGDLG